jgi:cell division septation protein DedD
MKIAQTKYIYVFLISVFFFSGCGANENKNISPQSKATETSGLNAESVNVNLPKDDVVELSKIINLPLTPEEVIYKEINSNTDKDGKTVPATDEKKLIAVLKFSAQGANQIVAQAEKYKPPVGAEIDAENWFPAELVAQSQLSGDETLKGTEYAANEFLQPPFSNGKITRISDTDFFVLELTSL